MGKGRHQKTDPGNKKLAMMVAGAGGLVLVAVLTVVMVFGGGKKKPDDPIMPDVPTDQPGATEPLTPDELNGTVEPGRPETPSDPNGTGEPEDPEEPDEPEKPEEPEPAEGPINPLTGQPIKSSVEGVRPYAVMMNNLWKALPQVGISKADVIYEVLVEGGVTRLLGIFQFPEDAPAIGSVRSARPYFIDLAQGHDAIFIHGGGSEDAYTELAERNVTHIDGVNGNGKSFFRDDARKETMGLEHSLMLDTTKLESFVASAKLRRNIRNGFTYEQTFSDEKLTDGKSAASVEAIFSSAKSTAFTYNSIDGLYYVSQHYKNQNSVNMVDGATNKQLTVRNIIIVYAKTVVVDDDGRLAVSLVGKGDGVLIRDGRAVDIKWSKSKQHTQFVYTLKDGSPAELGRGVSYVAIVSTTNGDLKLS